MSDTTFNKKNQGYILLYDTYMQFNYGKLSLKNKDSKKLKKNKRSSSHLPMFQD